MEKNGVMCGVEAWLNVGDQNIEWNGMERNGGVVERNAVVWNYSLVERKKIRTWSGRKGERDGVVEKERSNVE